MSINQVGSYGYIPYAQTYSNNRTSTPEQINFTGGKVEPDVKEKTKKLNGWVVAAVLGISAAAVWFFTKGKGRPYVDKLMTKAKPYVHKLTDKVKGLWTKVKNFFKGNKAGTGTTTTGTTTTTTAATTTTKTPTVVETPVVRTTKKPAADVIQNIDPKAVGPNQRRLVEQAVLDTPTAAQQKAYDRSIAYVKPTVEEQAAIRLNNAEANRASAISRQIQNNTSEASVQALQRAKAGIVEPNPAMNGIFNNGAAEFTLKEGKVVAIKAHDGRVITDPLKMAKYQSKHGVDVTQLKTGVLAQSQKQAEIAQSWAELNQARTAATTPVVEPKIPTSDEIWAMYEKGLI